MEEVKKTFWKEKGTNAQHGHDYESLICMRLLLLLEEKNKDFELANNMGTKANELGVFDDVVCKVVHDNGKVQFLFMQLKHGLNNHIIETFNEKKTRETPKPSTINRDPNDSVLETKLKRDDWILENIVNKCYKSYLNLIQMFDNTSQTEYFQTISTENFVNSDFELVFFTNRQASKEVQDTQMPTTAVSEILLSILSEGGKCLTLSDRLVRDAIKLHNTRDDSRTEEFAKRFRLCFGQLDTKEIERVIKSKINFEKSDLIYACLKTRVDKWFSKYDKVNFLTLQDHVFNNIIVTLYNEDRSLPHCPNIQYDAKFLDEQIQKKIVINVTTNEDLLLHTSLVENILNILEIKDFKTSPEVLIIDDKIDINLLKYSLRPKCSYKRVFAVITMKPENQDQFFNILKQFSDSEGKHLHVIIKENLLSLSSIFQVLKTNFLFDQFAYTSKDIFLEKSLKFQDFQITVRDLVGKETHLITEKFALQLAQNSKILIGNPVPGLGVTSHYYMPRFFIISSVNLFLLLIRDIPDVKFLILNKAVDYSTEYLKYSNCHIVQSKSQFMILSDKFPNQNVHLFEFNDASITYVETKGYNKNLKETVVMSKNNEIMCTEKFLTESCITSYPANRYTIISDIPGNGKSISLCSLAKKLQEINLGKFIVFINLNLIKEKFVINDPIYPSSGDILIEREPKFTKFTTDDAISFILKNILKADELETVMFKKFCNLEQKVILLIDSYDEIAPAYEKPVLSFIGSLKHTKIQNFIITTRPHCLPDLKRFFEGAQVLRLVPFEKDIQEKFIAGYWNLRFCKDKIHIDSDRFIPKCASELVNFIHNEKNDNFKDIAGIPLLLKIFSEVYYQDVKECNRTRKKLNMEKISMNFLSLYQSYFDVKLNILIEEKLQTKEIMKKKDLLLLRKEKSRKTHTYLAFQEIFLPTVIKEIFEISAEKYEKETEDEVERLGLIVKSDGNLTFIHRTFAEYFCAVKLSQIMKTQFESKFSKFLYENLLIDDEYKTIRFFLNIALNN